MDDEPFKGCNIRSSSIGTGQQLTHILGEDSVRALHERQGIGNWKPFAVGEGGTLPRKKTCSENLLTLFFVMGSLIGGGIAADDDGRVAFFMFSADGAFFQSA